MTIPPPRAVVFDLDGTLLDSLDDVAVHLERVLPRFGHVAPRRDEVARMVGDGARVLVARALGTPDAPHAPEVSRILEAYLASYAADPVVATRVMPGARELLDALAARGIPAVVCTNKPAAIARAVVAATLGDSVRATVGAGDAPRLKPHPDPILAALASISARPASSWMVGDGEPDVAGARAAGVPAIAYLGGYGREDRLRAAGADLYVRDLRELLPLL